MLLLAGVACCLLIGSGGQTHLLLWLAKIKKKKKLLMWGTHQTIRAWEIMPSGSYNCTVCHCFASFLVLRWTPKARPTVRRLDRMTNQTRFWRLAAHLISILFLLGTFSLQWAISWPNDEHRAQSTVLGRVSLTSSLPSSFCTCAYSCVYYCVH